MTAVLAIIKGIPVWVYALVLALGWGGVQHKRATWAGERERLALATAAAEEAKALRTTIAETERRAAAHQEIADAARTQVAANTAAAAAARADAGRVRAAFAAYAASAAANRAPSVGAGEAAEASLSLCADLLGRTANRAAVLADLADRSRIAGLACEQSYDSLSRSLKP